jgi:hypothetical protein
MTDDDPVIEYSPLCDKITRDGITVRVEIYRMATGDDGWSLEVIDQEAASTVWSETFASDTAAYSEFFRTLEEEGIATFVERPTGTAH